MNFEWERFGRRSKGRHFVRREDGEASKSSIIRRKDGYYVIGDDWGDPDEKTIDCPVLSGPFKYLKAAKVSYMLLMEDRDFHW